MTCKHDLAEMDTAAHWDGLCPLCLAAENERLRRERDHYKALVHSHDLLKDNSDMKAEIERLTAYRSRLEAMVQKAAEAIRELHARDSNTTVWHMAQAAVESTVLVPVLQPAAPDGWKADVLAIASDMEAVADTVSPRDGSKHPAPYMREQAQKLRALLR